MLLEKTAFSQGKITLLLFFVAHLPLKTKNAPVQHRQKRL
jgi:hypothetical protein